MDPCSKLPILDQWKNAHIGIPCCKLSPSFTGGFTCWLLNKYHSTHLSQPISPIEQWKIYFDVIYYIIKSLSTLSWICFSLFVPQWEVGNSYLSEGAMWYIIHIFQHWSQWSLPLLWWLVDRVGWQTESQVLCCICLEANKVYAHAILWNILIWIEMVILVLCISMYCIL